MQAFLLSLLKMSFQGGIVIAAVLIVRPLLKKAPKKWSYLLWAAAGYRLLCPVGLKSGISLFNLLPKAARSAAAKTPAAGITSIETQTSAGYAPPYYLRGAYKTVTVTRASNLPVVYSASPSYHAAGAYPVPTSVSSAPAPAPVDMVGILLTVFAALWLTGVAVLLAITAVRYIRLRRGLAAAERNERGYYTAQGVSTPFVMGVFRPRIFVPAGVDEASLPYVLAHERCHISRGDNVIKPAAFLIAVLHWFNPLCWLAYKLMNKDMEMSCDERVLSRGGDQRKAYGMALIGVACGEGLCAPGQTAFGENAVRSRIKNVMNWKKPKRIVSFVAALLCMVMFAACATDPIPAKEAEVPAPTEAAAETQTPDESDEPEAEPTQAPENLQTGVVFMQTDGERVFYSYESFMEGAIVVSYGLDGTYGMRSDVLAAMDQLLKNGIRPRSYFDVESEKVSFYVGGSRLTAYERGVRIPGEYILLCANTSHGSDGQALYTPGKTGVTPAGSYPGELGDMMIDRLEAYAKQYLGVDIIGSAHAPEGLVGEGYVVAFIQLENGCACCMFRSDDGKEWHEFGGGAPLTGNLTGACILSDNTAFLCYESKDGGPLVMKTANGGKDWYEVKFDVPERFAEYTVLKAGSPVFEGGRGVMIVTCKTADGKIFNAAFETTDGGETWKIK